MNNSVYYLAIGDSLTSGVGSLFSPNFVQQFALISERYLRTNVRYNAIYKNGGTTEDILNRINNNYVVGMIQRASIITITAGGNDIKDSGKEYEKNGDFHLLMSSLAIAKMNISRILSYILSIKRYSEFPYMIRILNLYNTEPELYEIDAWIRDYNLFLSSLESPNVKVADIYSAFYGRLKNLLFFDHIHPNGRGYQLMARQLYITGYEPLAD